MAEDGSQALEQFCLLAKSAKGRAVVGIIQQTLSSKRIYVFGELLAMPSVQALRGTEHAPHLDLLEIFAFGTYSDYRAKGDAMPPLTPAQLTKLRQLSLVSLARESAVVAYATMQEELAVDNVRDLEDAIIETIYAGLLSGKMDQMSAEFRVAKAAGRDVKLDTVGDLAAKLEAWAATAGQLSAELEENKASAKAMRDQRKDEQLALDGKIEDAKKGLKGEDLHGGAYDGMDVDRPKRRGKRTRMPFGK